MIEHVKWKNGNNNVPSSQSREETNRASGEEVFEDPSNACCSNDSGNRRAAVGRSQIYERYRRQIWQK